MSGGIGLISVRKSLEEIKLDSLGLLSWTCDPFAGEAGGATLTSQQVYFSAIPVRAGMNITGLVFSVAVAAAGTTPTTIKAGLYSTAFARLGLSANVAAASYWTAAVAFVQVPLTATYPVTSEGLLYGAFLQDGSWGTTQMQITRNGLQNATYATGPISGYPVMSSRQGGQTDLPATATFNTTLNQAPMWMGIY